MADVFVPDGVAFDTALARTTHLAIGAHQDDLEFFAIHGILQCFGRADRWFGGVTCTDGRGSVHAGPYAEHDEAALAAVRVEEQRAAAQLGRYSFVAQLGLQSAEVRRADGPLVAELCALLERCTPEVVYLHNPTDAHDTHVAVCLAALAALRTLPAERRPARVYGCEVWRGLDWLVGDDKVVLPVGERPHLQAALNGAFDSQIAGGKRYDLAVQGRRLANATFLDSYAVDAAPAAVYALDLTALVADPALDVESWVVDHVRRLERDVRARLARLR